jgi:hypothetical protein
MQRSSTRFSFGFACAISSSSVFSFSFSFSFFLKHGNFPLFSLLAVSLDFCYVPNPKVPKLLISISRGFCCNLCPYGRTLFADCFLAFGFYKFCSFSFFGSSQEDPSPLLLLLNGVILMLL